MVQSQNFAGWIRLKSHENHMFFLLKTTHFVNPTSRATSSGAWYSHSAPQKCHLRPVIRTMKRHPLAAKVCFSQGKGHVRKLLQPSNLVKWTQSILSCLNVGLWAKNKQTAKADLPARGVQTPWRVSPWETQKWHGDINQAFWWGYHGMYLDIYIYYNI